MANNYNVNIDTLVNQARPLDADAVAFNAREIMEIVNRIMPRYLSNVWNLRAEHVQRNNNMLFVNLAGNLHGLTNIHISFVKDDNLARKLHVTANIPSEWVSDTYQDNPVIHIYYNGRVGFQSDTAAYAQFITPPDAYISTTRLVAGLSQVDGPNNRNTLVRTPNEPGVLVDDLIRIFGRPNHPGRLPLGLQGENGALHSLAIDDIFTNFRNLLRAIYIDNEIQPLVNNIFNNTGQQGRLRGGLKTRKYIKHIKEKTKKKKSKKSKKYRKSRKK